LHTVFESQCTGCELCVPACPVDCIALENVSGARSGWGAWSQQQADSARERYEFVRMRRKQEAAIQAETTENAAPRGAADDPTRPGDSDAGSADPKRAAIAAALARARARRGAG
jgi:electron transport complex protein RnfB